MQFFHIPMGVGLLYYYYYCLTVTRTEDLQDRLDFSDTLLLDNTLVDIIGFHKILALPKAINQALSWFRISGNLQGFTRSLW